MGWAARANPRAEAIPRDLALIRGFLRRHPDQLTEVMRRSAHDSWQDVQAWMEAIDHEEIRQQERQEEGLLGA